MNDYLQHYQMRITALSPIHIGDGRKISKKEYIQLNKKSRVIIPDVDKMLRGIQMLHKEKNFEEFMLDKTQNLTQWLEREGISEETVFSWKKYALELNGTGTSGTPVEIKGFIKDGYGIPYVPGSSIKGMIRTALLAMEVKNNPPKFAEVKRAIERGIYEGGENYLEEESNQLETTAFYKFERDECGEMNITKSYLSGLRISDSKPISLKNLTLTYKFDYSKDKKTRLIRTSRESLIPGTDIFFELTIDTSVCKYTIQDILKALDNFQEICYKYFYSKFERGKMESGVVWLGGGVGFLSKTVMYAMFEEKAARMVNSIFKNTIRKAYIKHGHINHKDLSPHVCKCTKYRNRLYDMGMGRIEVISG